MTAIDYNQVVSMLRANAAIDVIGVTSELHGYTQQWLAGLAAYLGVVTAAGNKGSLIPAIMHAIVNTTGAAR